MKEETGLMVTRRTLIKGAAVAPLAGVMAGRLPSASVAAQDATIRVGSKNFPEALIIGEIYAQALEAAGFGVERSLAELEAIGPEARAALASAPVWILDGNAYTSRPGPRLVEGAERIAAARRGEELPGLVRWRDAVSLHA